MIEGKCTGRWWPMIDAFGFALQPLIEKLLSSISKPSNVKARLSTIEAYTIWYPLYKTLACLKGEALESAIKLAKSLEKDPTLVYFTCRLTGGVGLPKKAFADVNLRENLTRALFLLYIPEPVIDELAADQSLKRFLSRITGLLDNGEVEKAHKHVHDRFSEKYAQGDVQIPSGEVLVREALLILLTLAKLGTNLDKARARAVVENYYVALSSEMGQNFLIYSQLAALSLYSPPDLFGTISENLSKWRQSIPSPESNPLMAPYLARAETFLRFSYNEFKKAFQEMEAIIEP